ncbi:hypothetical protein GF366_05020 [Candidatus Peregrinibacteria bacterium]|nr:hypothetical protein [Candidatus Peregrinibacteria bacterium]
MKKNKFKKIFPVIFVALFSILVIFVHLDRYYEEQVVELNQKIFSTLEKGGFTLFSADKVIKKDGKKFDSDMVVGLEPGEEYKGLMGIKNHYDEGHEFYIWQKEFKKIKEDENKVHEENLDISESKIVFPEIIFSKDKYFVLPEEVTFFDYTIRIPEEVELGKYKTQIAAKISDSNAPHLKKGPVVLELAFGVPITIIVSDDPPEYEYKDLSQQAYDVAKLMVIDRVRYILTFVLILVSIYFVFKGFTYDSKKSKK